MVRHCSVYRCKSLYIPGGYVSFHQLPLDPVRRNRWIEFLKETRKPTGSYNPGKYSCICSEHFTDDCFRLFGVCGVNKNRLLKPEAVPTIFVQSSSESVDVQENSSSASFCTQLEESDTSRAQAILQSDENGDDQEQNSQITIVKNELDIDDIKLETHSDDSQTNYPVFEESFCPSYKCDCCCSSRLRTVLEENAMLKAHIKELEEKLKSKNSEESVEKYTIETVWLQK